MRGEEVLAPDARRVGFLGRHEGMDLSRLAGAGAVYVVNPPGSRLLDQTLYRSISIHYWYPTTKIIHFSFVFLSAVARGPIKFILKSSTRLS